VGWDSNPRPLSEKVNLFWAGMPKIPKSAKIGRSRGLGPQIGQGMIPLRRPLPLFPRSPPPTPQGYLLSPCVRIRRKFIVFFLGGVGKAARAFEEGEQHVEKGTCS
jgi:hypothetical protein